jgi:hypothetical protein
MGLLVFGIVLGVIGAIMRFAVKVHTTGFNINTGGLILLIVGIGCAVIGLALLLMGGHSRTVTQESVQATPSGRVVTDERSQSSF